MSNHHLHHKIKKPASIKEGSNHHLHPKIEDDWKKIGEQIKKKEIITKIKFNKIESYLLEGIKRPNALIYHFHYWGICLLQNNIKIINIKEFKQQNFFCRQTPDGWINDLVKLKCLIKVVGKEYDYFITDKYKKFLKKNAKIITDKYNQMEKQNKK